MKLAPLGAFVLFSFTTVMKDRVHQLTAKLNVTKKENHFISEFVFRIRDISYALLVVGERISEEIK